MIRSSRKRGNPLDMDNKGEKEKGKKKRQEPEQEPENQQEQQEDEIDRMEADEERCRQEGEDLCQEMYERMREEEDEEEDEISHNEEDRPTSDSSVVTPAVNRKREELHDRLCPPTKAMTSELWKYFRKWKKSEILKNPELKLTAVCLVCLELDLENNPEKCTVNMPKDGSTCRLQAHLFHNHRDIAASDFMSYCMEWMVMTYQPFNTCVDPYFRKMVYSLNPKAKQMTIESAHMQVKRMEADTKFHLDAALKGRFYSLTVDHWTADSNENFVSITCNFIDEKWEMISVALGCVRQTSKAPDIVSEIFEHSDVAYQSLERKYLMAVVTDTTPNMVAAGNLLIQQHRVNWLGCFAHILELTASLAFDDTHHPGCNDALKACRNLNAFFAHSTQALQALLDLQGQNPTKKPVGVIQDVAARWWSTFQSLERLLRLKPSIDCGATDNAKWPASHNLTDEQWATVLQIVTVLRPFRTVQQLLEGENYFTISLVSLAVTMLRKELAQVIESQAMRPGVVSLAKVLLESFNTHWGNGQAGTVFNEHKTLGPKNRPKGIPLPSLLASAIDPRTKHLLHLPPTDRVLLLAALKEFIKDFNTKFDDETVGAAPAGAPVVARAAAADDDEEDGGNDDPFCQFVNDLNDQHGQATTAVVSPDAPFESRLNNELVAFSLEPALPIKYMENAKFVYNDPLKWWQTNSIKYPILSRAAKALLCVTATSASSEMLFSQAGRTIAAQRARLHGDNADALIFLHSSMPVVQRLKAQQHLG